MTTFGKAFVAIPNVDPGSPGDPDLRLGTGPVGQDRRDHGRGGRAAGHAAVDLRHRGHLAEPQLAAPQRQTARDWSRQASAWPSGRATPSPAGWSRWPGTTAAPGATPA